MEGSAPQRRHAVLAYALWGFGLMGFCGLHRLYLRRPVSGSAYLFSVGFFGIGQLLDLMQMQRLLEQANQPFLLAEARRAAAPAPEPLERQLLRLARRSAEGFTLNDALLAPVPPHLTDVAGLRRAIDRLQHDHLLEVGNDDRGRIVYREP
jgi:hypothetical protein